MNLKHHDPVIVIGAGHIHSTLTNQLQNENVNLVTPEEAKEQGFFPPEPTMVIKAPYDLPVMHLDSPPKTGQELRRERRAKNRKKKK